MQKSRFFYWYVPLLFWASLLVVLTSLPKLRPPSLGLEMQDKLYHLLFYMVLGFLWARAVIQARRDRLISGLTRACFGASLFAILDELHQLFIPGRQCDLGDAIADIIGLILAILLYKILFNRYLVRESSI
jgi:VanZ family protein